MVDLWVSPSGEFMIFWWSFSGQSGLRQCLGAGKGWNRVSVKMHFFLGAIMFTSLNINYTTPPLITPNPLSCLVFDTPPELTQDPDAAPENEFRGGNSDSSQVLQIIHDFEARANHKNSSLLYTLRHFNPFFVFYSSTWPFSHPQ